jgi:hypothetical protein
MSLATCRECQGQVSTEATSCPHCGAPNPIPRVEVGPASGPEHTQATEPRTRSRWWWFLIGGCGALVVGSWLLVGLSPENTARVTSSANTPTRTAPAGPTRSSRPLAEGEWRVYDKQGRDPVIVWRSEASMQEDESLLRGGQKDPAVRHVACLVASGTPALVSQSGYAYNSHRVVITDGSSRGCEGNVGGLSR